MTSRLRQINAAGHRLTLRHDGTAEDPGYWECILCGAEADTVEATYDLPRCGRWPA